jgi:hypothetical protein
MKQLGLKKKISMIYFMTTNDFFLLFLFLLHTVTIGYYIVDHIILEYSYIIVKEL